MPPHEVLIIGAGPIGLEVAWHLQAAGHDAVVVDAGAVGQTILSHFPPATRFFSSPERIAVAGIDLPVPTQEKVTGEEYLAYLRSVVRTRQLQVRTFVRVVSAVRDHRVWRVGVQTPAGTESTIEATHVVLAFGGTQRPRPLGIPGEDLPHVHTNLGDPHRFFQRRVLVVGGKNSAIESALRCWRVHASVTISYRGPAIHERVKYWLRPEVQALVEEGEIEGRFRTIPIEITPDEVVLQCLDEGSESRIPVDDVILQIGFEQNDHLFRLFGVPTQGSQAAPVFDAATLSTPAPGVFVAGTAVAGTQERFKAYIETSHDHGPRIAAAIAGAAPPPPLEARVLPES